MARTAKQQDATNKKAAQTRAATKAAKVADADQQAEAEVMRTMPTIAEMEAFIALGDTKEKRAEAHRKIVREKKIAAIKAKERADARASTLKGRDSAKLRAQNDVIARIRQGEDSVAVAAVQTYFETQTRIVAQHQEADAQWESENGGDA